jgi:hypothetical protein
MNPLHGEHGTCSRVALRSPCSRMSSARTDAMAAGRCCACCALRKKPRAQGVLRTSITEASNSAQARQTVAQRLLPAFQLS